MAPNFAIQNGDSRTYGKNEKYVPNTANASQKEKKCMKNEQNYMNNISKLIEFQPLSNTSQNR